MVKVKEDLAGSTFGRLTVIQQAEDYVYPSGNRASQWLCECNCANKTRLVVRGNYLKSGHTQSCGCLQREKSSKRLVGNKNGECKKKYNKKDLSGDFGIIWSTNTNQEIYFDLVDADNILKHTWLVGAKGYPVTHIGDKIVTMHVLLGCKGYDHDDRNRLNNRRNNLRPATAAENSQNRSRQSNNTSGIIGLSWNKKRKKWETYIQVNKKTIKLGFFVNKQDAIIARLKAEAEYFQEFAPQRHLFSEYNITIQN